MLDRATGRFRASISDDAEPGNSMRIITARRCFRRSRRVAERVRAKRGAPNRGADVDAAAVVWVMDHLDSKVIQIAPEFNLKL
jgi:hypothetical protein